MTRGILIIGNESPLFSAVAEETASRVEAFAATIIPGHFQPKEGGPAKINEKAIILPWNPSSPISTRTLVFAAENRMKQIHDAIIICSPPTIYKNAEDLLPEEIEILVNEHIKGWFLLVRELVLYFQRTKKGSLSLVESIKHQGKGHPADLLGQSAAASFRAFAQGLLSSSLNEACQVMGFSASEADSAEKVAAWVFAKIDKCAKRDSGRWHKFSRFNFL